MNFLKHTARPLIATPPLVRLQKHSSKPKLFHLLLNLRPGKTEELGRGQTPSLSRQYGLGIVISFAVSPHCKMGNGTFSGWSPQVYFSAS